MNTSAWQCEQCTYSNHRDLQICELCNWVPHQSTISKLSCLRSDSKVAESDVDELAYITCLNCSFNNSPSATQCMVCEDTDSFDQSYHNVQELTRDTVKIKCPRCHVNLPVKGAVVGHYGGSNSGNYKSSVTECPTCDFDLTTGQQVGNFQNKGRLDQNLISGSITEGLIELIAQSLSKNESEDLCKSSTNLQNLKYPKKITIEYALCSPCNHVSQRGSNGYEWSCGYRNIQMMCYSLLNISNSDCDYKSLLFNGKGWA